MKKALSIILTFMLIMSLTTLVHAAEPVTGSIVGSDGTASETLTFSWDADTTTLTISGSGKMPDFGDNQITGHFAYKALATKVVVEEGVTALGKAAFRGFNVMAEISLPSTLTSLGQGWTFYGCSKLTALDLSELSITEIGYFAFSDAKLTSLKLPATLKTIKQQAFYGTKLTEITIPKSVTTIETLVFNNSDISSNRTITFEEGREELLTLPKEIFGGSSKLATIYLPEKVTFAESVADIKDVFMGGASWNVTVPSNVKIYARDKALKTRIDGLTDVDAKGRPTVISLPSETEAPVLNRETATFNGYWGYNADTKTLYVCGTGGTDYYGDINPWKNVAGIGEAEKLVIGEGITYAGGFMGKFTKNIKSLELPSTLTNIGQYAFQDCSWIEGTLVIPQKVTTIQNFAFSGTNKITEFILPASLTSIGNSAFQGTGTATAINVFAFGSAPATLGTNVFTNRTVNLEYFAGSDWDTLTGDNITKSTANSDKFDVNLSMDENGVASITYLCGPSVVTTPYNLIVAAYNANGKLIDVTWTEDTSFVAGTSSYYDGAVTHSFETAPEGVSYYKGFVWDGFTTLRPLSNSTSTLE